MKIGSALRSVAAALVMTTAPFAAHAAMIEIDQLVGYLRVPALNSGYAAPDLEVDSRGHITGGDAWFGLDDILAYFYEDLETYDDYFSGGSFGWTIFNRSNAVLEDVQFFLYMDATAVVGGSQGTNNGGGSAGDYSMVGTFDQDWLTIPGLIIEGLVPSSSSPQPVIAGNNQFDSLLFAIGMELGDLAVGQGVQLEFNFGNTGLFGADTDTGNIFHLDARAPYHVPEPAMLALMSTGLIALGIARRRSRSRAANQRNHGQLATDDRRMDG